MFYLLFWKTCHILFSNHTQYKRNDVNRVRRYLRKRFRAYEALGLPVVDVTGEINVL